MAVALLTWAVGGQRIGRAFALGLLSGIVFFAILLPWLIVVGWDAWMALTGYSALWIGVAGALTAVVMRVRGWVAWVPLVWVAQEAVRDRIPLGGWPWGRLGFSQAEAPWLPVAGLGGVPLLTFAVALAGAALVWVALSVRHVPKLAAGALVAVLTAPWLFALVPSTIEGRSAPVGIVQGDVPATGLGFAFEGQRRVVLDNHVRETILLAEAADRGDVPAPRAVIWPENASDLDPYAAPDAAVAISTAARTVGVPILVGAVIANPNDPATVMNVGIVWDPETGPGERYVKLHPVPFGEYLPFRSILAGAIDRFALLPRDYVAGDRVGVLDMNGLRVGDVICFEVAYDDLVRDTVLGGATTLAVQTNNATYTGRGQTEQQLAMAKIRAVEFGRSTVVAATNGISAAFLPDGTEVGRLGESTAGFLVPELPQRDAITLAARVGPWPEWLALAAVVVLAALGVRRPARIAMQRGEHGRKHIAGQASTSSVPRG